MIHDEPHRLAGETVKISEDAKHPQLEDFGGSDFIVEDWWDRVFGKSWMDSTRNPAAMVYGIRSVTNGLTTDNEVLYGKMNGMGVLVHVSELET